MIQYLWALVLDYGPSPTDKSKLLNVYGNAVDSSTTVTVVGIKHHLMNCNMGVLRSNHLDASLDRGDPLTKELLDKTKFTTSRDACLYAHPTAFLLPFGEAPFYGSIDDVDVCTKMGTWTEDAVHWVSAIYKTVQTETTICKIFDKTMKLKDAKKH